MEARKVLDTNVLIYGETGLTTILNVVEFPKSLQKNNDIIWPSKRDYLTAIEINYEVLNGQIQIAPGTYSNGESTSLFVLAK